MGVTWESPLGLGPWGEGQWGDQLRNQHNCPGEMQLLSRAELCHSPESQGDYQRYSLSGGRGHSVIPGTDVLEEEETADAPASSPHTLKAR